MTINGTTHAEWMAQIGPRHLVLGQEHTHTNQNENKTKLTQPPNNPPTHPTNTGSLTGWVTMLLMRLLTLVEGGLVMLSLMRVVTFLESVVVGTLFFLTFIGFHCHFSSFGQS